MRNSQALVGIAILLAAAASVPAKARDATTKQDRRTGTINGTVESTWVKRKAAVVYIKDVPGEFPPPKQKAVMDQKKMTFVPDVLPVLAGTTAAFPNSDSVQHNVYSPPWSAKQFNLGLYPAGVTKHVTFENVGVVPLLCNVHSEMSAFVVVLPHPYFATTDRDGKFTIENVPEGKYELRIWHEKLTPQTEKVRVVAGKTTEVSFRSLKRTRRYEVDLLK